MDFLVGNWSMNRQGGAGAWEHFCSAEGQAASSKRGCPSGWSLSFHVLCFLSEFLTFRYSIIYIIGIAFGKRLWLAYLPKMSGDSVLC